MMGAMDSKAASSTPTLFDLPHSEKLQNLLEEFCSFSGKRLTRENVWNCSRKMHCIGYTPFPSHRPAISFCETAIESTTTFAWQLSTAVLSRGSTR
jgi:hypothetical protein